MFVDEMAACQDLPQTDCLHKRERTDLQIKIKDRKRIKGIKASEVFVCFKRRFS